MTKQNNHWWNTVVNQKLSSHSLPMETETSAVKGNHQDHLFVMYMTSARWSPTFFWSHGCQPQNSDWISRLLLVCGRFNQFNICLSTICNVASPKSPKNFLHMLVSLVFQRLVLLVHSFGASLFNWICWCEQISACVITLHAFEHDFSSENVTSARRKSFWTTGETNDDKLGDGVASGDHDFT